MRTQLLTINCFLNLTLLITSALSALSSHAGDLPLSKVFHHWGRLGTVYQYGQFYAAASPDSAALQAFKQQNGALVVDLRSIKELDCSSRTQAKNTGLAYQNFPIDAENEIPAQAILRVETLLDKTSPHQSVLISCKTGNRAAAILAIHAARVEHLDPSQTLTRARQYGLKSKEFEKKFRHLIETHSELIEARPPDHAS